MPLLHTSLKSDPKLAKPEALDNYLLPRMTIIGSATGSSEKLLKSTDFNKLCGKTAVVCVSSVNMTEVHTALVTGCSLCIHGASDGSIQDALRIQISDLARLVIDVQRSLFKRIRDFTPTSLEKKLASSLRLNFSSTSRLCQEIGIGTKDMAFDNVLQVSYYQIIRISSIFDSKH